MIRFSIGLIFSSCLRNVFLLRKQTPAWQVGFLHGVGGKKEGHESFADCMAREGREEAGFQGEWISFARISGNNGIGNLEAEVFYSIASSGSPEPCGREGEKIERTPIADIDISQLVSQLPLAMLIPTALAHLRSEKKFRTEVIY